MILTCLTSGRLTSGRRLLGAGVIAVVISGAILPAAAQLGPPFPVLPEERGEPLPAEDGSPAIPPSAGETGTNAGASGSSAIVPLGSTGNAPIPLFTAPSDTSRFDLPAAPGSFLSGETAPLPQTTHLEITPLAPWQGGYPGPLNPSAGGLAPDLWQGADRAFVGERIPLLPSASPSLVIRDLIRRVLLSAATPPEGEHGVNLTALRVQKLLELGAVREAAALTRLDMTDSSGQNGASPKMMALFLAGDSAGACQLLQQKEGVPLNDLYAQEAFTFCHLEEGRRQDAELGLDLLREAGVETKDPAYVELMVSLLTGKPAKLATPPATSPVHIAMLRKAGIALPDSFAKENNLTLLGAVAIDPHASNLQRLTAAERLATFGLFPLEELAALYRAEPVKTEEIAKAASFASGLGPHYRAARFQAAERAAAGERARLIENALQEARQRGDYLTALSLHAPLMKSIPADPAYSGLAPDAVRGLYLTGQAEAAERWLHMIQKAAALDRQLAQHLPSLLLIGRIFGHTTGAVEWQGGGQPLLAPQGIAAANPMARTARVFAALEGLDLLAGMSWDQFVDPATVNLEADIDRTAWFGMADAARNGETGKTLLLGLSHLSPLGGGASKAMMVLQMVSALRMAGFPADARALALETMIASGL